MIRSANQLSTALYKAWRAAGLSPGCAREVGRAGLWLAADPTDLAAAAPPDGFDPARYRPPVRTDQGWRVDPTCAALHGPSIAELLVAHPDRAVVVAGVDQPRLLKAMLDASAAANQVGFTIDHGTVDESTVTIDHGTVERGSVDLSTVNHRTVDPVDVPNEVWERLGRWAEQLLVPATEASRAGAGAGSIDND